MHRSVWSVVSCHQTSVRNAKKFCVSASVRGWTALAILLCGSWATLVWAADRPTVVRWDFGAEETTPLRSHGGVHRDVPGPRPPIYPDFEPDNTAVKLDGRGAHLSYADPGEQSFFDFTNGDAITLEAWVQVDELRSGENVYVVSKGRTGATGFAADNQNWALRVREQRGKACVSFLFATPRASGAANPEAHWHRWTTNDGFTPGKAWHHIAVAYRFGDPKSVRGWIDGKPQTGNWDMGGETTKAPIVDNDAVWIGSSRGGAAANSFRGSLDSIAIHRLTVDDAVMITRFRREGEEPKAKLAPEVMPELGPLPAGRVLATFHEGMPDHVRWLNDDESLPEAFVRWETDSFLLDRLPLRYDAWGIRQGWQAPVLVRLAADVVLEPGQRTFLLRARGLSRLWVNGKVIARTKPLTSSPNGEEEITPVAQPPLPGLRPAEHRQQEVLAEAEIGADGACRVVLEMMAGGQRFRPDPGETCVAVKTPDGKMFELLAPADSSQAGISLTDAGVTSALADLESRLSALDDLNRRAIAASQVPFWEKRHSAAQTWAQQNPAPAIPNQVGHPVDAFLAAKVERALAASAKTSVTEARQFHTQVLPILREQCFRCHGDKDNGGLRLNSRAAVLKGGDSELPAVTPGNLEDSELIRRILSDDPDERMPPGAAPLAAEQIAILKAWVKSGANWPAPPVTAEDVAPPAVIDDAAFLRRVTLDTIGLPPTEEEIRSFLADRSTDKRERAIDRLLADERWADHWVSYWQDVLAENPTLINSSLNTTGPFRWFLYDALRDNRPMDRMVTELILLRGGAHDGGSAGFGIAGDNDAPLAAKGQIVASAFLGIELQCARCHDSPYHSTKQRDLYALAAMFDRKPVTVPPTSRVPTAFFDSKARESLIKVSLKLDESIPPSWPFAEATGSRDDDSLAALMVNPKDTRERLAALITSPRNERFAQVIVNRVWRRLMGAGFVEPADDWEGHTPSHPDLLTWLSREFITHQYDVKHVARLILTSEAYQRASTGKNLAVTSELRFFVAPERRRLTAEQIVDSLYAAGGQKINLEELTFDPDGRRASSNRLTLGAPRRAWMLANLANERDRPSLNLPRARAISDVLTAFGWTGARQNPRTDRETEPNVLQPGVLENSMASVWLTRAAQGSGLAELAVHATSPDDLVDSIFLRYLGRLPSEAERAPLAKTLSEGFESRLVSAAEMPSPVELPPLPQVTWSNHLSPESNTIALEMERRARLGPNPDLRLRDTWREVYEDVAWTVVNVREFVWMP